MPPSYYQKRWYNENRSKAIKRATIHNQQMRWRVIEAYGAKCVCCGETTFEALAIDHINNDGAAERRKFGYTNLTLFLLDRPIDRSQYQVLCHTCNVAKSRKRGENYCKAHKRWLPKLQKEEALLTPKEDPQQLRLFGRRKK